MFTILRAASVIASWTMVSRVLGFLRDILLAHSLGAGPMGEAFVVAFRLPNLFRRLFAEGSLNAALVPLYTRLEKEEGLPAARQFASEAFSLFALVLFGFTALALIFMPQLIYALAPGLAEREPVLLAAIALGLITFPYLGFIALSAFVGGILGSYGRFWAVAAAPVLLNILMIAVLASSLLGVIDAPTYSTAHLLAWAVSLAGLLQLGLVAWQAWRFGVLPRLVRPSLSPSVRRLLSLMAPGLLGAGIVQINLVVATQIASTLGAGAVAYLYYADRLSQLPLGVVGVGLSMALLPALSRQLQAGDQQGGAKSYQQTLELGLLFSLPSAIGLILLADPIVLTIFQHGAFSLADAAITADCVAMMAIGIPGMILSRVVVQGFFACEDTRTPAMLAGFTVVVNIIAAFALSQTMGVAGVALAPALAAWVNLVVLFLLARKRLSLMPDPAFWGRSARILLASVVMGGAIYLYLLTMVPVESWGGFSLLEKSLRLAGLVGMGLLIYAVAAFSLKVIDLRGQTIYHKFPETQKREE